VLFLFLLLSFCLAFDLLEPKESEQGCWRYTNVQNTMQAIVDVAIECGDPVLSAAERIDYTFGIDGGKFGGTIVSVNLVHSRNGLGTRDVRNCHIVGIGEVPDNRSSLKSNFPEWITFMNSGKICYCLNTFSKY
jgi:hypothetical protein